MQCYTLVVIAIVVATSSACHAGPVFQWTGPGSNGHYYQATDATSTWTDADALATSLGGYLVSVTSADEQSFLASTFFSGADEDVAYWIGFTDQATEGTFVWTSGEPVGYTNWITGEPNDYTVLSGPVGEDYAVVNWASANGIAHIYGAGKWNDAPDGGSTHFGTAFQPYRAIIEYNSAPAAVPEPASLTLFGLGAIGLAGAARRRRNQAA